MKPKKRTVASLFAGAVLSLSTALGCSSTNHEHKIETASAIRFAEVIGERSANLKLRLDIAKLQAKRGDIAEALRELVLIKQDIKQVEHIEGAKQFIDELERIKSDVINAIRKAIKEHQEIFDIKRNHDLLRTITQIISTMNENDPDLLMFKGLLHEIKEEMLKPIHEVLRHIVKGDMSDTYTETERMNTIMDCIERYGINVDQKLLKLALEAMNNKK